MLVIEQLAKGLDLDTEGISADQFVAAKRNHSVIGFGRIRSYADCAELATVGVLKEEQRIGIGSMIVNELIRTGPSALFVTCVIPEFFKKFGFQKVEQYPPVLRKKVDFCKSYDFTEEQIFVMRLDK